MPQGGYAADRLRTRRQRWNPAKLLSAVLEDLLLQCGFGGYHDAVADSVAAARRGFLQSGSA